MNSNRPRRLVAAAADSPSAVPAPGAPERILLDLGLGGIDVSVLRGGRRVVFSMHVPPELRPLLPGSADGSASVRDRLRSYFLANGNAHPVIVRHGRRDVEARWQGYSARETCVEADLADADTVVLRHVLAPVPGGGRGTLIREGFWFDLQAGAFGLLPRDGGWRAWHRVRRFLSLRDVRPVAEDAAGRTVTFRTRDAALHGIPLGIESSGPGAGIRFRIQGRPVAAPLAEPSLELKIRRPANPRSPWVVRASLVVDGNRFPLSADLWRAFRPGSIPAPVRRAGEEEAWIGSLFDALDPGWRAEVPGRGGDTLRGALEAASSLPEVEARAFPAGDRWLSFITDRGRQARMLAVPFRLFGPRIFAGSGSPGEMIVPAGEIRAKLHDLLTGATEAGVSLSFDELDVVKAGMEITVRAEGGAADWFEVRPEISVGGEALPEEYWTGELMRDGFLRRGDRILLLDPGSLELLEAVAASVRRGRRRDPGRLVRIPRLAILDLLDLRRRGLRIVLPERDREVLERLAGFEAIPGKPVPRGLGTRLRPYQAEGYGWIAFLYENRLGACLADDMGLGKTVQAIAFLEAIREGIVASRAPGLPSLVVVPPSLLFNWEREIARFCPSLRVAGYRGKDRELPPPGGADVVLTTYDIVRRDIDRLAGHQFDVAVFDEAQTVKNLFAKSTGAARKLRRSFSLALTGTPVENHLGEYFSILDLVVPGILGDYDDVRRLVRKGDPVFLEAVRRRSRPFVLRRAKEAILPELPRKVESDLFLELTDRQKALYRRAAESAREEVERAYRTRPEGRARVIALTAILRLRQLCLSPELLVPGRRESSPKIDFLMTRLAELRDEGHSVLVFSQFTSYLDLVERAMREEGIGGLRLDGSTPVPERKRRIERFRESPGPSVFLLSLKAGGKGLNLEKASYVILLDPWWNPAVERQAADRAHRIGQLRKVSVLRLLMRHTVEEKMVELSARKTGLYRALLGEPGTGSGAPLSREDFAFLLGEPPASRG